MEENVTEKSLEEATTTPRTYKRVDVEGGVLTNEQDIDNYITTQHNDIRNNYMLGMYNENGDYYIDDDILKALVNIPKIKLAKYQTMQFLTSTEAFGDKGVLQFCVVTTRKDGKASATLKLMEPVNKINGYIQNTNMFATAFFTDVDDDEFLAKTEKVFNIYDNDDAKSDPSDFDVILARILFLKYQQLALGDLLNDVEKEYYEERLAILEKSEYAEILKAFKALREKTAVFLDPNDPRYYSYLNELLDQSLDNHFNKNPELKGAYYAEVKSVEAKRNQGIAEIESRNDLVEEKAKELSEKSQNIIKNVSSKSTKASKSTGKSSGDKGKKDKKKEKGKNKDGGKGDKGKNALSKGTPENYTPHQKKETGWNQNGTLTSENQTNEYFSTYGTNKTNQELGK